MVCSEDPKALGEFYSKVLGKEPDMAEENGYWGFLVGNTFLTIGPHDRVKGKNLNPERVMINFDTKDVPGEFERIKGVGAKVVAEPYEMGDGERTAQIATFEDLDGNYFQLMTPWEPK